MIPLRFLLRHTKPSRLLPTSIALIKPHYHSSCSAISSQKVLGICGLNYNSEFSVCNQNKPNIPRSSPFHISKRHCQSQPQSDKDKMALLSSQMNMRLLNENSFLSWCRNAYLSSVVGIAMMEEATTSLGQTAGFGAFLVGGMNVFWGTSCHITNLIRLRHVSGMSGLMLSLNILGSGFHCLLWLFVLTCYIGFLDDPEGRKKTRNTEEDK